MALDTFANLKTSIEAWLDDADTYDGAVDDIILMAESEFNRRLRVPEMEVRSQATVSGQYLALPDDFLQLRAIYLLNDAYIRLDQLPLTQLRVDYAAYVTGQPRAYAINDGQFVFGPQPDTTYTAEIVYYAKIPALSVSNTTNWLLTAHPDLYLAQCMGLGELFGFNDPRAQLMKARADEIIDQLDMAARKHNMGSAPIRMSHGVNERLW